MRILWIVNILFPEAGKLLGLNNDLRGTGGWLLGAADVLSRKEGIELGVMCITPYVRKLCVLNGDKMTYYVIPQNASCHKVESLMSVIEDKFKPDVVHVHGTELPYGEMWLNSCTSKNVVVSIQGLVSVISRYYFAGLSRKNILLNLTIHDLLKKSLFGSHRQMIKRGQAEMSVLKKVKHVIGRTTFDKAHALSINPSVTYHFCNETLRETFYEGSWSYSKCNKHTIFVSQAASPIKGLHMVLKALPLVQKQYPDTILRIAGRDITKSNSFKLWIQRTGYGKLIGRLISKMCLWEHVVFTGPLNAEQMKDEYLNANVFVCPSSIENSSNSLAEAQILGVPCVASFVGGIPDMVGDYACCKLYRYEEVEMLAFMICELFKESSSFDNSQMKNEVLRRHDRNNNTNQLIEIYNTIIRQK